MNYCKGLTKQHRKLGTHYRKYSYGVVKPSYGAVDNTIIDPKKFSRKKKTGLAGQKELVLIILTILLTSAKWCGSAWAEEYTDEEVCSAIKVIENSKNHPYGILKPYCTAKTEDKCLKGCLQTVQNNRVRYEKSHVPGDNYFQFLAKRYCPIDSDTDNGTCVNWYPNLMYHLAHPEKGK